MRLQEPKELLLPKQLREILWNGLIFTMEDTVSVHRHGGSLLKKGKTQEAAFLKFAEKNKINDVFVPWTEINHPDFPGKKTEVGGIKPFAMINPPADTLDDIDKQKLQIHYCCCSNAS